jgi:hypothetical protein
VNDVVELDRTGLGSLAARTRRVRLFGGIRSRLRQGLILLAWAVLFTVLASLGYRRSVRWLG